MAFVVTDRCRGERHRECAAVCNDHCFYEDDAQAYIHPDECIECGACETACPVGAIFHADELPPELAHWEAINAEKCETGLLRPMDPDA